MLSSRKILKLSLLFWPRKVAPLKGFCPKVASRNSFTYASFCTAPESPELPDWIKYCEHGNPSTNRDDFVLPKIAAWAESRKVNGDHTKLVKHIAAEIVDSDLNKLCEILKEGFDSVDAVGGALSECDRIQLSESLVLKVLLRFRHDWIPSFRFFNWAKQQEGYLHTENCYNMMVDILGMSKNFEMMWELIEEMNKLGGLVSMATMSKAMRRLAKCGKHDEVVEAFDKFERFGLIRQTAALNLIIEVLVKASNVECAQKVYIQFKDKIQPSSHTFNILVNGWCRAKKPIEAEQAMAEMVKYGYQPDVYTYTCLVEYYCDKKDFRKVDAILDDMRQKGCPPNVVTYTIIMRALGNAKDTAKAIEVCDEMNQSGCVPDASFYSALIHVLSESGKFMDACNIFKNMPKGVPDVLTYNTMIGAACKHSREEYAFELLKDMEEASCIPDVKTYTILLKMCCQKKRMKVLNYLLADMFTKGVSLDLSGYCLLVNQLCKSGKLEHACSFFEQMVFKGMVPWGNTYKLLIGKLEEKGMIKAKRQIENLMQKGKK
ncbi:pentatricopeptide repeat-containing protein At3g22670, mitochondrial-like [Silene latifolia]|uniref:pentatricopeptide repeat-containing protein At3g22670, mitochondrial-like n=1 Tax=Silene latifolia TaxID=37657 RepID=UPI003D78063B